MKYIFDNFTILKYNEKLIKRNNSTINMKIPKKKIIIKKENNNLKTYSKNKNIDKKLNITINFEDNITISNLKNIINKENEIKKENEENNINKENDKYDSFKLKEIQNSKYSTNRTSYNNFNIKVNLNEYENKGKNKNIKTKINIKSKNENSKSQKNMNIKNNSKNSPDIQIKKENSSKINKEMNGNEEKEKENNIDIKPKEEKRIEEIVTKKINILKKIEMDSYFGIGDNEVKNDNQDYLFVLTNNPSIAIFKNTINNYNLFIEEKKNSVKNKINNQENLYCILGICDGHGEQGRTISNYISTIIPNKIKSYLNSISNEINEDNFPKEIEPNIKSIFSTTNKKLNSMQIIDTSFSGTCLCSLLITQNSIISINLGNSKAIIGCQKNKENKSIFYPYNLTIEHTPLIEKEKERIIENGGDILYEKDEYNREFGPLKVWKKNILVPGLLITRSFGDKEANFIGVISEPEIRYFEMKNEYKFVVIGSFGLWNFIKSEECVKIIGEYYLKNDIHGGVKEIMKIVKSRWIEDKENIIEDISIILGFFKENKITII